MPSEPMPRKNWRAEYRNGIEVEVPENSGLVGMTFDEVEQKFDVRFDHYHKVTNGRYSQRLAPKKDYKIVAGDVIKYFGRSIKDVTIMLKQT
jgi:hypothetical protein